MSSIWYETPDHGWKAIALIDGSPTNSAGRRWDGIEFVRFGRDPEAGVALLAAPHGTVRVNGYSVPGGLRLLEHKDEIVLGTIRLFFSAESTPAATVYRPEAGTRLPSCPICRGPIKAGEQAVQCPGCARWYHQLDPVAGGRKKHCWTYSDTCRFCGHPTALSGDATWQPEKEACHA